MTASSEAVPNHHADYPGFAGVLGLVAALTMVWDRRGDIPLAERLSDLTPQDTVVDVGCGPGTAVRRAAQVGATVTGVDPAPVMLQVARLLTKSHERAHYSTGTAEALPVPDGSVSVLWAIRTVHHWQNIDAALTEARRVLAPAGRFVAIERRTEPGATGHASHGWTNEQAGAFADICKQHGFVDAHVGHHESGSNAALSVSAKAPAP